MDSKHFSGYSMVDTGAKAPTHRVSVASGRLKAAPETLRAVREGLLPKGNALPLAEAAGITAVKKTAELLPLCHPLPIDAAFIRFHFEPEAIEATCEVRAHAKTGVEMEALCGVTAALLCLIDLMKGIDPVLEISEVRLQEKIGGKSGHWIHPRADTRIQPDWTGLPVSILTLSDRCAKGEQEDRSGPALAARVREWGASLVSSKILPDESSELARAVEEALSETATRGQSSILLTTGGTGIGPRDITPETLASLGGRPIAGFGEKMRRLGEFFTPYSILSRGEAFALGRHLVLCLPGNPNGALESLEAVARLVPHSLKMLRGGNHG